MKKVFLFLFVILSNLIFAQDTWSLDKCFDHALKHNIAIKQVNLSTEFAKSSAKQSKMNLFLPMANASVNETFSFGYSIDPTTYQFVNRNTNSTSFGLNLSYGLFEGLTKINTLKANKQRLSATEFEIEEAKDNTKIFITNLYLQIIIAQDVIKIAEKKQTLTQNQYKNSKALVDAGILAKGSLLDIDAQLASDELSILDAESNIERALNQLKLLLQLDPYKAFEIEPINIEQELQETIVDPQSITSKSMDILPQMKALEYRRKAAEYDLKVAKGSLYPSLSLSGNIGTRYFSEAQYNTGSVLVKNIINFEIAGTPVSASMENEVPIFSKTPFLKQLEDNLSESISLGLNIPILGGWQRRTAIENAKLNIQKTDLDFESKKNKINEDVFNAYTDLNLSQKRYKASLKSSEASNLAFNYANEKFKAGIINSLELETAKNRKINSDANTIQAKYDLFFKKMILNYYETGELKF